MEDKLNKTIRVGNEEQGEKLEKIAGIIASIDGRSFNPMQEIFKLAQAAKRPEVIEIDNFKYIYNDDLMRYEIVADSNLEKPQQTRIRTVCNVESFAKAVIEENERRSDEEHINGRKRTVIFNEDGATFFVDDNDRNLSDKWVLSRQYTLLWETVKALIIKCERQPLTHRDLLLALEKINRFIPNYEELYNKISKLHINKKLNFVSNPIFEDGEQAGQFGWEQRIENGQTEHCACPAEILFRGELVRGSSVQYEFYVRLMPVLDEERGKVYFQILMPCFEAVLDQIREDEYSDFCKLVKDLDKLLILRNY